MIQDVKVEYLKGKENDKTLQINILGFRYERILIPNKIIFNYWFFKSKTINTMIQNITEYIK